MVQIFILSHSNQVTMLKYLRYNKVMNPKLIDWDENFASENEKKTVSNHNLKSGISSLQDRIYE